MKKNYTDHPDVIRYTYKGRSIRFRKVEEDVVYIAVTDITNLLMCHTIKWDVLRMNCYTCSKIEFYKGKLPCVYGIEHTDLEKLCKLGCHGQITAINQEKINWIRERVKEMKNQKECKAMENNIQIFKNEEFGQVRIINNKEPLFCLTDICQVLDLTASKVSQRLNDDVLSKHPIIDSLGRQQLANFVNEDGLYDVILDSRKSEAKQFRKWITKDVLPSIRKHGAYMTSDTLEKAILSPDFLIELANKLKEEQQLRIEAEEKNVQLLEDNNYQKDVIEGLTENISLADMRQRITQIVRKGGIDSIKNGYRLLYSEFDKKYHINVATRMNNVLFKGNKMDYIEQELKMLPELYELTCKLFESNYDTLMKEWGKNVKRAKGSRK